MSAPPPDRDADRDAELEAREETLAAAMTELLRTLRAFGESEMVVAVLMPPPPGGEQPYLHVLSTLPSTEHTATLLQLAASHAALNEPTVTGARTAAARGSRRRTH